VHGVTREVTLTFVLLEDVTPDIFATRVAATCGHGGGLRPGEGVRLPSDPRTVLIISEAST
jgi:hypothetical protein